jgi:hypothetical protein
MYNVTTTTTINMHTFPEKIALFQLLRRGGSVTDIKRPINQNATLVGFQLVRK